MSNRCPLVLGRTREEKFEAAWEESALSEAAIFQGSGCADARVDAG